jgi:hypothetical protein
MQFDATPMRLDDFAGDCQPQTTAPITCARFVDLIEALENAFSLFWRNV